MSVSEASIQAAYISWLRSQPTLMALIPSGTYIKEFDYQSNDWQYPAIRVSVDYYPSTNGCGTDTAEIFTEVYSDEKSSKTVKTITETISNLIHKRHFRYNGILFITRTTKVSRSVRSVYAWKSAIQVEALVA